MHIYVQAGSYITLVYRTILLELHFILLELPIILLIVRSELLIKRLMVLNGIRFFFKFQMFTYRTQTLTGGTTS